MLTDHGLYARIAALRVLGPSSAWFRIALASLSRASSSGVCGGSAVGEVAAGLEVDPASWAGRSECPCRVVLSSHRRSKCRAAALPLDWVRIAAGFDRCAHDTGLKFPCPAPKQSEGPDHVHCATFLLSARILMATVTRDTLGNSWFVTIQVLTGMYNPDVIHLSNLPRFEA